MIERSRERSLFFAVLERWVAGVARGGWWLYGFCEAPGCASLVYTLTALPQTGWSLWILRGGPDAIFIVFIEIAPVLNQEIRKTKLSDPRLKKVVAYIAIIGGSLRSHPLLGLVAVDVGLERRGLAAWEGIRGPLVSARGGQLCKFHASRTGRTYNGDVTRSGVKR